MNKTLKVTVPMLIKALVLCNESRNRLTGFQSTPDFWIYEAEAEMAKEKADSLAKALPPL